MWSVDWCWSPTGIITAWRKVQLKLSKCCPVQIEEDVKLYGMLRKMCCLVLFSSFKTPYFQVSKHKWFQILENLCKTRPNSSLVPEYGGCWERCVVRVVGSTSNRNTDYQTKPNSVAELGVHRKRESRDLFQLRSGSIVFSFVHITVWVCYFTFGSSRILVCYDVFGGCWVVSLVINRKFRLKKSCADWIYVCSFGCHRWEF